VPAELLAVIEGETAKMKFSREHDERHLSALNPSTIMNDRHSA